MKRKLPAMILPRTDQLADVVTNPEFKNGKYWTVEDSVFATVQRDTAKLLGQCFDTDWNYCKVRHACGWLFVAFFVRCRFVSSCSCCLCDSIRRCFSRCVLLAHVLRDTVCLALYDFVPARLCACRRWPTL